VHGSTSIHMSDESCDVIKLCSRYEIRLQATTVTAKHSKANPDCCPLTLFSKMTSADAICFSASTVRGLLRDGPVGRKCCEMCFASTTAITPSSTNRLFAMLGRKNN
jgi:hypothetical protein